MPAHVWQRYVAIGDSFTEGMVDADPAAPGAYVGWADRLAQALSADAARSGVPFAYANLAVRGRKLDDVVGRQLDAALAMEPDLVSMVGGGNDILRPSVDLDALAGRIEEAVIRLRAAGIDVLLATPTDPRDAGLFKALRPRHALHTANLFTIAARHGAHVLNLWGIRSVRDWRMWGEDRIHLSTEGHIRVADAALVALGLPPVDPDWDRPMDPQPPAARAEQLRQHLDWARTHAAPWVERRVRHTSSGDTLDAKRPGLTPL
ncbi:MAG: SGNH/GDSL hydrolase family protein [Tetrasphaera sp.]|jgi:lysophospholipase L1-like esterase|nr:SGNH/GDSL hydrolase family protein [Tetrasphaera sp.]